MSTFEFKGHIKDEVDLQLVQWEKMVEPRPVNESDAPTTNAEKLVWIEKIYKAIVANKDVRDSPLEPWSWTRGKYTETAVEVCAWEILVRNSMNRILNSY
jgi:hypothetical protein